MTLHTTPRSEGKKTNERKSMDSQSQNETSSEATKSLKFALFLVPRPQIKNTSFSRRDEK